ncbi:DUF2840 domain-containing protein [Mesorhizobium jarvisii]|uniref:DUF2840 domain-containing protein n=1 Tax=Mesorhizobium jarvisii TaxID=1777867 RepID=UPI001F0A273D|nr:DUF2840 domain-containing protein [Mesorhizobium jarvisii]MCH4559213.1 DUF2840 domain-containing protein [Mesorhizobium jarvisii]
MTDNTTLRSASFAGGALQRDGMTGVGLTWIAKKIEFWIRFGLVDREDILDRHQRVVWFRPGVTFAFVRWASNGFGTIMSRLDIVRTIAAGQAYQTLPFVRPGGDILLTTQGWQSVERVLQIIDAIERLGINPQAVSPDHWRHVHHRMTVGQEPRTYTLDLHLAFLLRRRIEP